MTAQKIYTTDGQVDITDILFENRNKAYGAYELRKHYDERVNKSMLITLSIFVLLFLLSMVFISHKTESIVFQGRIGQPYVAPSKVNLPTAKPQTPAKSEAKPVAPKPDQSKVNFIVVKKDLIPIIKPDSIKIPTPDVIKPNGPIAGTDLPGTTGNDGQTKTSGSNGATPTQPDVIKTVKNAQFMPQFPGGEDGLDQYLQNNIKFTNQALYNHAEGKIVIDFIIDIDGSITNVKVVHDYMGYGCQQNAIDVIKNMPTWAPGSDNGHLVRVEMTLPITYKVN